MSPDTAIAAAPAQVEVFAPEKPRGRIRTFIRRHPSIALGGSLLFLMVLAAVFAPLLSSIDPQALAPARRVRQPSAEYWFGTDMLGRDVYTRVIYGTRVSLIGTNSMRCSTALSLTAIAKPT